MPWFPVDDGFHSHPKARKAGMEAIGLWTLAGSHCMAYLTDGFVADWWVKEKPRGVVLAKRLVAAGLWRCGENDGEQGYWFHDWKADCTKASITADRRASAARQEVARNPQLRAAIRARDGDNCRYCRTPVEWNNRRGATGGTYDHVFPDGGSVLGNLVVCCRGCNARKGRRTPQQAGMKLYPPPGHSESDLSFGPEISESVPGPHHSTPLHTTGIPGETLGGGVTQVDARGPRPHCPDHETNSPGKCTPCKLRREWDEAQSAIAAADQLDERRRRKEARENCPRCHGTNTYEGPDGLVRKCDPHLPKAAEHA